MKMLIVDDEFVSRKKAQKILNNYGLCDVAINGTEALKAFYMGHAESKPYQLITMDINMPDMDGIEALTKIRTWETEHNILLGKGVKVIMLTASKDSKSVLPSFNEGCEAYILKPFNKKDLDVVLEEQGLI